jgi:hypothetical protein
MILPIRWFLPIVFTLLGIVYFLGVTYAPHPPRKLKLNDLPLLSVKDYPPIYVAQAPLTRVVGKSKYLRCLVVNKSPSSISGVKLTFHFIRANHTKVQISHTVSGKMASQSLKSLGFRLDDDLVHARVTPVRLEVIP